jgi:carbon monoxide dehydrogenase subunit G
MRLQGSIDIAAPATDVWGLLVDPVSLAACVPGASDVRQIDERTFEGRIRTSVGPIDGDFSFRSVLTSADFPAGLVVDVEGTDSVTKSQVSAHVEASVDEADPARTTLRYAASVTTRGRLAIIGEMVLRAAAGAMVNQVARCLRSHLEAPAR